MEKSRLSTPPAMAQLQASVSNCFTAVFISVIMMAAGAKAQNYTMFLCYGDVCNAENTNQFCSERYQKCRDCDEVVDDCLTKKLPANCTITCVKYLLDQAISKEKGKSCHDVEKLDNGHHNATNLRGSHPGTVVSFKCDTGFRLIGAKDITCQEYGIWSKDPPVCVAITCNPLNDVMNGKHNGSDVRYHRPGEHVTTHCRQGYRLHGDNITTCGSDGEWSTALPTCIEITCAPLQPIVNGGWIPSATSDYFKQWQNITGSCHSGFIPQGSALWRCMESGWESLGKEPSMIHCIEPCSCTVPIAIAILLGVILMIENLVVVVFFCKRRKSRKSRKFRRKVVRFSEDGPALQNLISKNVPEHKVNASADRVKSDIYDDNTVSLNRIKTNLKKDEPALPSIHTVNEKPLKRENPDMRNEGLNGARMDDSKPNHLFITVSTHVDNSNTNNNGNHNTNKSGSTSGDLRTVNDIPVSSKPTPSEPETTKKIPSPANDKYPVEEVSTSRQEQPETNVTHSSQESGDADNTQTDCKTLSGQATVGQSEAIHRADVCPGFVRAQGNNEQDVNQKLALNTDEVPMGDVNGASTAPNGVLPKPLVVPSAS